MTFGVDLASNPLLILSLTKEYLLPTCFSEKTENHVFLMGILFKIKVLETK